MPPAFAGHSGGDGDIALSRPRLPTMRLAELEPEELDCLEPMWRSLYEHQREITEEVEKVAKARTPSESWATRRAHYERWLREPGAFALLARVDGEAVGYALARLHQDGASSWNFGSPHGELETLSVLPNYRGQGIGTALLREVRRRFRAAGATTMMIGVISTNEQAQKLYKREGAVPFITTLVAPLRDE